MEGIWPRPDHPELYLNIAYRKAQREGPMRSLKDLQDAIHEGAVKRVRPKFMTVATLFMALAPSMLSTGAGADVMKRTAHTRHCSQ